MATTAARIDDWFLTAAERGNPATSIDRRRGDGRAWTEGNLVHPLVHGSVYYARLLAALSSLAPGDMVNLADWRGDPDERLDGPGTEVGRVLADLARKGVQVRGLLWRSHLSKAFSERQNLHLGDVVNKAGGEILLDQRVRGPGSHHQKLVVAHVADLDHDVAFAGGIDLSHGRRDDQRHHGDPQTIEMNPRYGRRPPWHDVQLELRGPAVGDLAFSFRERWEDPTPLDHRNPVRALIARRAHQPRHPSPLPPMRRDPGPAGPHAVQVLRTYPSKHPPFPFAPRGERSIARAYHKALGRARRLVYIEDQYLWSAEIAKVLADALDREPDLQLVAVLPPYPESPSRLAGVPERIGRERAIGLLREAGGDRVAVYSVENEDANPIYVHAKVCVIDDVWVAVGSDNFNRRSWTHDSELACAVLDPTRDERAPVDPAGMGDGARVFARNLRLGLWCEHLGREPGEVDDLLDPATGVAAWRETAERLAAWHRGGRRGPRPPGRALPHTNDPVPWWAAWWAGPAYLLVVDPDGRPLRLRLARRF
jgi:phosphatidylserine/phosphatidylglycerophosphate/cardiolipin synthase-like enzyme